MPQKIEDKGNPGVGWFATFENKNDKKFIGFKLIMIGKIDNVMEAGQKLMLRLEDNTIISLTADGNFLPEHLAAMGVYTHYNLKFSATAENMLKISQSPLTDLQLQLTDKQINGSFSGRKGSKFMETAACFL